MNKYEEQNALQIIKDLKALVKLKNKQILQLQNKVDLLTLENGSIDDESTREEGVDFGDFFNDFINKNGK